MDPFRSMSHIAPKYSPESSWKGWISWSTWVRRSFSQQVTNFQT
jgi:hypothetical protein